MFKPELVIKCANSNRNPKDLTNGTAEKVIAKCEDCGELFERRFNILVKAERYRCISCTSKEIQSRKEVKENKTKVHTEHKYNMKPFSFHEERVKEKGYIIISTEQEFIDTGEIVIKCEKHDYIFKYKGKRTGCKKCAIDKSKKTL